MLRPMVEALAKVRNSNSQYQIDLDVNFLQICGTALSIANRHLYLEIRDKC